MSDSDTPELHEGPIPGIEFEVPEQDVRTALEQISRTCSVVLLSGKVAICRIVEASDTTELQFMTTDNFYSLCAQYKIKQDGRKPVSLAHTWFQSPYRRTFNNLTCESDPSKVQRGSLNTWRGLAVKPAPGDWSLFRYLMREVLCAGNETSFQYLLKWAAWSLQNPTSVAGVAVVLKGLQGTGKGFFGRTMTDMFGRHGSVIAQSVHLDGHFNAHLANCCMLHADEANFAGNPDDAALKNLVTEPTLRIEPKGIDSFPVKNCLKVILTTNAQWAVRAAKDARRYFILDVSEAHKRDLKFFGSVQAQLDSGGREAMAYDLLAMDLSDFQVLDCPMTAALRTEQAQSLKGEARWAEEILSLGVIGGIRIPETAADPAKSFFAASRLYDSLREFWRTQRAPMPSPNALGRWLGKFLVPKKNSKGERGYTISYASRKAFEDHVGIPGLFSEDL